jgi:hypothetical protein
VFDPAMRGPRARTPWTRTGKVLQTYRADDDGGDGHISEIEILRERRPDSVTR